MTSVSQSNDRDALVKGYKEKRISVAEKIIADISTGIYRTPAAALKELITNAYDADATRVEISTGVPEFKELVIRDNGCGMSAERFLEIMQHIGGSWKRIENKDGVTKRGRRVIGRIGVGLLAVAQLGQRFYVSSSKAGEDTRFLAEVDLRPFHKDDAALRSMSDSGEQIEIGVVKYIDGIKESKSAHYTVITVPNPKRGLISEMHNRLRDAVGAKSIFTVRNRADSFLDIVKAVQSSQRADTALDGYHYMLWEAGLLCPVRYLDCGPFDPKLRSIEGVEKVDLESVEQFSVKVDGYDIRRPILFPNPTAIRYGGPDPILFPVKYSKEVAGRVLSFHGYVYSQKPHIYPNELTGLQIRIRCVGIGGYDKTWLGYPFDEGIKFGQVSGEIFVTDGLESALNIDRASFRETDPHFLTLRAIIWEHLRNKVFPEVKSKQRQFRSQRKKGEEHERDRRLADALNEAPEDVTGKARISDAVKRKAVVRTKNLTNKTAGEIEVDRTEAEDFIRVVDGDVEIDDGFFREATGGTAGDAARERLLRVVAALAAYGIWNRLRKDDAKALIRALLIAVE